jgi:hypothetical protein
MATTINRRKIKLRPRVSEFGKIWEDTKNANSAIKSQLLYQLSYRGNQRMCRFGPASARGVRKIRLRWAERVEPEMFAILCLICLLVVIFAPLWYVILFVALLTPTQRYG